MQRQELEALIRRVFAERSGCPVRHVALPGLSVRPEDRLDTGAATDRVYTRDLFTLAESPRLGAGLMQMHRTRFAWTLDYDELDYVIEGSLTIECGGLAQTAGPGEVLLIPKGSRIHFSAPDYARFLYVTYPADWQAQAGRS